MASFNKVILMGNLTRDPEVRYIPSGTAVCEFGLAVNEKFKNQAGDDLEQVCFVDIIVWGKQGETCGEYLSKGRQILVEGRLQLDQWKTKEGDPRSRLRVRADRVQFLGNPKSGMGFQDSKEVSQLGNEIANHEKINDKENRIEVSKVNSRELEQDDDNLPF